MKEYKPQTPFLVPAKYFNPTETMKKGVVVKDYEKNGHTFYCSFRTFGGTETNVNGVLVVENTATIETWFTPNIKAQTRIEIDGVMYELLTTPENIAMRNKWLRFKVRAIRGGA